MIKIHNKTHLSYKTIGQVIDHYINKSEETTLYVGKIDRVVFTYKENKYEATVKYGERDVSWSFYEIDDIKYEE